MKILTPVWQETDLYEPMPDFDPNTYYTDDRQIQKNWERQMEAR